MWSIHTAYLARPQCGLLSRLLALPHTLQLTLDNNDFEGSLYPLAEHSMVNFNAAENPKLVGHQSRAGCLPTYLPSCSARGSGQQGTAGFGGASPLPTPRARLALQCGMVPVGLRFAHGFNPRMTGLGLPCPDEVANGWQDLSEVL